ncbi:MAG: 16S rRNA (uracil(1498)-N(3))-methyltransferase [Muribaculaceae bacterium]|nr:16S rRNA (uracil(1498)-N(3))-methyltransferase [Muribaculaceae bacterium]
MHLFYCPEIASTGILPEEESRHCVKVLRLVEGDEIDIVDGNGTWHHARITMAHHKRCAVEIVHREERAPHWPSRIVVAIAPTKNIDRIEWMIEKTTEMGIDRIIPLQCRYSERKEVKTERLRKILVSAMKQSLKATLPQLDEMTPVMKVIGMPFEGKRYIAYCDMTLPREQRKTFAQVYDSTQDALVLIGPEGDFSPEEVNAALAAGFIPVTLGDSRLRTETAAVQAVASCHTIFQLK